MYQNVQELKVALEKISDSVTVGFNVHNVVYRRGFTPALWQHQKDFNTVLLNVGFEHSELVDSRKIVFNRGTAHVDPQCFLHTSQTSLSGDKVTLRDLRPTDNVCMACDEVFMENFSGGLLEHTSLVFAEYVLAYRASILAQKHDLPLMGPDLVSFRDWVKRLTMFGHVRNFVNMDVEPGNQLERFLQELTRDIVDLQKTTVNVLQEALFSDVFREEVHSAILAEFTAVSVTPSLPAFSEAKVIKVGSEHFLLSDLVECAYPLVEYGEEDGSYTYVIVPGDVAALCVEYVQKVSNLHWQAQKSIVHQLEHIPATDMLLTVTAVRLHEDQHDLTDGWSDGTEYVTLMKAYQVAQTAYAP